MSTTGLQIIAYLPHLPLSITFANMVYAQAGIFLHNAPHPNLAFSDENGVRGLQT